MGDNGHKSNWVTILKNHLTDVKGAGWTNENLTTIDGLVDAIKAVTDLLPNGGALSDLAAILTDTDTTIPGLLATIQADLDNPDQYKANVAALALEATLTAIKGAGWTNENLTTIDSLIDAVKAVTDALPDAGALTSLAQDATVAKEASLAALALEATLTAIKGGGWATETLVAIKAAIDVIGGVNTYQEQIPDTDFDLAAIDTTLTADPPIADAENSVVDIDQVGGSTFVLRSIWINVTSFGTGATLTFKLWTLVNAVVTMVDSVDVASLGIQNLADIFGLQEVHADGIWITVQTDVGTTGACEGTYRYAIAS